MKKIEIYKNYKNQTKVAVQFDDDTVWLSLKQMAELFERDKSVISRHLKNIFEEGELIKDSVVARNATTAKDGKRYQVEYFNLDTILSVGYRVNSRQGIEFRKWANGILTKHLLEINKQQYQKKVLRLEKELTHYRKMIHGKQLIFKEIADTIIDKYKNVENDRDVLLQAKEEELNKRIKKRTQDKYVREQYQQGFLWLNQYDNNELEIENLNTNISVTIKYEEAKNAIENLKKQLMKQKQASELFGQEKDKSFQGILVSIIQIFNDKYLYNSIEQQAAHLLYFIVKNHPFVDGNKRIGALIMVWFLQRNITGKRNNIKDKIPNATLVALTLLVAESAPQEKETIINLIINLIRD